MRPTAHDLGDVLLVDLFLDQAPGALFALQFCFFLP